MSLDPWLRVHGWGEDAQRSRKVVRAAADGDGDVESKGGGVEETKTGPGGSSSLVGSQPSILVPLDATHVGVRARGCCYDRCTARA